MYEGDATTILSIRRKVVFIGNPSTGKTSLLNRIVNDKFLPDYDSTIGVDFFTKTIYYNESIFKIQLWDSAGQEKYRSLIPSYIRGAALIFLVYDLSWRESFEAIKNWLGFVNQYADKNIIKLVLVGNKSDLTPTRKIEKEVIEQYCKNNGIENYFEVSAKSGENIHELFKSVVRQLFIKFALPIINDNRDIQNNERELPFDKKFFNQNTLGCYKSCCYNQ